MKTEMRRLLAREPYEKKIEKVEQLLRLVKEFPRQRKASVAEMRAATRAKSRRKHSA
jgi:hypothetical protein